MAAEPSLAEPSPPSRFDAALAEADRRFVAGDLEGALHALEPVCAGTERPECSFSLGAIHHGLGHCAEALEHYRRYAERAPHGEHIQEVSAALEEVESRCGAAHASPESQAPPPRQPGALGAPGPAPTPVVDGAAAPSGALAPLPPEPASTTRTLMIGSLVLSGTAAATSLAFGILAAESARHCGEARRYDDDYIDECEQDGPRYQGLWQGFALASGGFLGIGLALWWFGDGSSASVGVSASGQPALLYGGRF